MESLPKAAIVRLLKANGAERVGADAVNAFIAKANETAAKAVKICAANGRSTVQAKDVENL